MALTPSARPDLPLIPRLGSIYRHAPTIIVTHKSARLPFWTCQSHVSNVMGDQSVD